MSEESGRELRWLRRLSVVPRWVIMPTINKQTVDAHSFHVAVITRWLMEYHALSGVTGFRLDVLELAITHDMDEAAEGDRPSPSKGPPKNPAKMGQVELVVKIADILEALLFLHEEEALGNKNVGIIIDDVRKRLNKYTAYFKLAENAPTNFMLTVEHRMVHECFKIHPGLEARNDEN